MVDDGVSRARYVVHRLQRDSPPKEANRFSAFIRDQWADGAGGLGKHMRVDGGMYAPWLKVWVYVCVTAQAGVAALLQQ